MNVVSLLAPLVLALAPVPSLAAPDAPRVHAVVDDAKVVVSLTTGDVDMLRARIVQGLPGLAAHYRAQGRGFRAVVVVHGEAYRFFLRDLAQTPYADDATLAEGQAELQAALAKLASEQGVRFELCSAGMKKRGIKIENLMPFATPIVNANVGLIDWQQRGYAYLPVGP